MHRMVSSVVALQVLAALGMVAQIQQVLAQEMQPGQWHFVTEGSTVLNGQQSPLPKNEMNNCVSAAKAKEAADILRLPQGKECKTELLWRSGGRAKTRTTCPTSVVTSDYDLAGSSYRSVTHMEVHQDSNTATTDLTVTGTRIGDCTP